MDCWDLENCVKLCRLDFTEAYYFDHIQMIYLAFYSNGQHLLLNAVSLLVSLVTPSCLGLLPYL